MNDFQRKDLAVVILAAGKGKRMKDPTKAKVMFEISGQPMLGYVLETVFELKPKKIILVVGNKKDDVIEYATTFNMPNLEFSEQLEQLGTGHAVEQTRANLLDFNGDVLILAGDVPLLNVNTLKQFIVEHNKTDADLTDLTAITRDPFGYGRIVRDEYGNFIKIVEEKDANDNEKLIKEINSGTFLIDSKHLFDALSKVKNNNAQEEYYLTDLVAIMKNEGLKVIAFPGASFDELQGVNSTDDLKKVQEYFDRI